MNKNLLITILIFAGLLFSSCKDNKSENNQEEVNKESKTEKEETIPGKEKEISNADFAKQSVDDKLANKIRNYLTTEFLTEGDLRAIKENQRKFQLYKIDLNNDGKKEVFVNFMTPYFCGSGGCTVLLLDNNLELITKFSPTRILYVEKALQNDWRVLVTRSDAEWRKLIYENGTYPTNPTMVEIISESPSREAVIMFDEVYKKSKIYDF